MDFTVSRERVSLEATDVRQAAQRLAPGPIRAHAVEIDGVEYPVKQVFAEATHLDLLDFTTNQARHVLKALGFSLRRIE